MEKRNGFAIAVTAAACLAAQGRVHAAGTDEAAKRIVTGGSAAMGAEYDGQAVAARGATVGARQSGSSSMSSRLQPTLRVGKPGKATVPVASSGTAGPKKDSMRDGAVITALAGWPAGWAGAVLAGSGPVGAAAALLVVAGVVAAFGISLMLGGGTGR